MANHISAAEGWNKSTEPPICKEIVKVKYSRGEKVVVGGISIAIAIGLIALVGAVLSHLDIHPSFLSHLPYLNAIPMDTLAIGLTGGGGGLILLGLGGTAYLKWREHQTKKIFSYNKQAIREVDQRFLHEIHSKEEPSKAKKSCYYEPQKGTATRYVVVDVTKEHEKCSGSFVKEKENTLKKITTTYEIYRSKSQANSRASQLLLSSNNPNLQMFD